MTSKETQFQNENIIVNLKKDRGCKVRLDITVSPAAVQAATQKAVKTINKEVSIPGFRKGKAPQNLIQKNFGKQIEKESRDVLLNTAFEEALNLTKIMPFDSRSVKDAGINSISPEGASVYVVYESTPDVPNVDTKQLSLQPVPKRQISEKDVQQAIDEICLQQAQWTNIHDRAVAEGDFVDIDIDKVDEPSYNLVKNGRFEVAQGKMGKWMRELLIGRSPGETAEGMSEQDETSEKQEHEPSEFKPTLCRITLKSIKSAALPHLDDELAQKLQCQNVEDLKNKIQKKLTQEAEEEHQQMLRAQIERELIEHYPFDIPQSLIDEQLSQSEQGILNTAKARKTTESVDDEVHEIQHKVAEKLDRDFRLYFLARKVANEHNIQVSQDELMQEMMRQVWLQSSGQSIIDNSMDPKEVRSRLYTHVLMTKAIDFLINSVS